jgi:hypothetical protein
MWTSAAKQSIAGVLTAACIVAVLSIVCWKIFVSRPSFDPAVWRAHREARDETLTDQADALVSHRSLDGRSRDEVIAILGPPTFEESNRIGYVLGMERSLLAMDSEWLTIFFGADGKVMRYKRWQD